MPNKINTVNVWNPKYSVQISDISGNTFWLKICLKTQLFGKPTVMCRHYKQQSCNKFNVQMVLLRLESWISQWCHPVRGVEYNKPWWFSELVDPAMLNYSYFSLVNISVYAVCIWMRMDAAMAIYTHIQRLLPVTPDYNPLSDWS